MLAVTLFCGYINIHCNIIPSNIRQPNSFEVLGIVQDGGRPHLNCTKECCLNVKTPNRVASIAVHGNADWVLVDATPDMVAQIQDVGSMPKAILLTHAHMGHYIGLAQLGREAMSANNMNVWCSESMASYLKNNGPWSQLVELNNIKLNIFSPNEPFEIIKGVKAIAHSVPHRKEFSDTHAFELEVNNQKALYVPDIDSWEEWPEFLNIAEQQDFLLIDATFYDNNELGNRDMSQIPHPRVTESMDLLEPIVKSSDIQVYFIHINHTNPILDKSSNAYKEVKMRGFNVSKKNDVLRK